MAQPSVASLLLDNPKTKNPLLEQTGDVLNFASPNEEAERARQNRLAGNAMGWNTSPPGQPAGPLAPTANLDLYRTLRQMQQGGQ